jgi:hypothetical protein
MRTQAARAAQGDNMHWNWNRRFVHQVVATLLREQRDDLVHRFLVAAMSLDTAKKLLGFDETVMPSPDEIKRAWKQKALEHHPDRGGSPEMMKQINVAHDVLLGKQHPDRNVRDSGSRPAPSEPIRHQPPPYTEEIITWDQAAKTANVPTTGVDWKFVTTTGYGGYGDNSQSGFVVYGRAADKHVFVSVYHSRSATNMFTNQKVDTYEMRVQTAPLTQDLASLAPKVIRQMWQSFGGVKGYGAKVYILPEGAKFEKNTLEFPKGRKISFKDAMSMMGEATPTAWKGKVDVVLELAEGLAPRYPDDYGATLVVNGKPYKLSDASNKAIWKVRLYGIIWGKGYYYGGSKKNLTRIKSAKKVLTWLSKNLKGEPQDLIDALTAAAEKAK